MLSDNVLVETVNPKRKEAPKGFLKAIVGATNRQNESKRVEEEVASGSVEDDLVKVLAVSITCLLQLSVVHTSRSQSLDKASVPTTLSLHERSFDLVLLSNWEDQIIYEPDYMGEHQPQPDREAVTAPINHALEKGTWTRSIIWDAKTPFRDFTQLELEDAEDENQKKVEGSYPSPLST